MTIDSGREAVGFVKLCNAWGRTMVMSLLPEVLEQFRLFVGTSTEGNPLELVGCLWLTMLSVFALK